jgi:chromosome segregation ATPase
VNRFPTNENQEDEIPLERDIRMNDEGPGFSYQDEMRKLRFESQIQTLKQRITLLSILIPCLLGAIVLFAYLEFNDKLNKIMATRTGQVEALSENVDDKIVSLSHDYKQLQQSLSDNIANFKKFNASIRKDLGRNRGEIKKLTASKAGKKALEQAIAKESAQTAKTLEALRSELHGQKEAIENLDATLKKEVAEIVQVIKRLKENEQKQDSAIKHLSKHKFDKEDLGNILKDKWSSYEANLSLLRKEINALKDETSRLQEQLDKEKPAAKTTRDALIPPPDKIIEQEIKE